MQINNVVVAKAFQRTPHKSFRQTMTPEKALELGNKLTAAGMHQQRYEQQQKPGSKIRTEIKPINEIIITTYGTGQITILGKFRNKKKKSK